VQCARFGPPPCQLPASRPNRSMAASARPCPEPVAQPKPVLPKPISPECASATRTTTSTGPIATSPTTAPPLTFPRRSPVITLTKRKASGVPAAGPRRAAPPAAAPAGQHEISPVSAGPMEDPDFQEAASFIATEARRQKVPAPVSSARRKRTEVEKAAVLPAPQQKEQSAKERSTNAMSSVAAKQVAAGRAFNAEEFKKELKARVAPGTPANEGEARRLAAKHPAVEQFAPELSAKVAAAQQPLVNPLLDAQNLSKAGSDPAKPEGKIPVPVYPSPPNTVDGALLVPDPKPAPEVSVRLQAHSDRLTAAMEQNRLSDDQLANSREQSFLTALSAKQDAERRIVAAQDAYRVQESELLETHTTNAGQTVAVQLNRVSSVHIGTGHLVTSGQTATEAHTKNRQLEIKQTIDGI
jgi:hypothetical protein